MFVCNTERPLSVLTSLSLYFYLSISHVGGARPRLEKCANHNIFIYLFILCTNYFWDMVLTIKLKRKERKKILLPPQITGLSETQQTILPSDVHMDIADFRNAGSEAKNIINSPHIFGDL